MKASVLDLRYHMKDVLKALARNETVDVFVRGRKKAVLSPAKEEKTGQSAGNHPAFGIWRDRSESVQDLMNELRKDRYFAV